MNNIQIFQSALIADGITPSPWEQLAEACDPNAYAADVLGIEVLQETIQDYNAFAAEWDEYIQK